MLTKSRIFSLIFFNFFLFSTFTQADPTFGYLSYSTRNIGDDIQSIAAKQFLPESAVTIDRDYIQGFESAFPVHTIMNGWYMQTKQSGWPMKQFIPPEKSWPPSQNIDPLLISMHISQGFISEAFTQEGIEYLKQHGPVGARDFFTLRELQQRGIPAYFSGCLTLTLEKREDRKRSSIIYAVDIDPECVAFIQSQTRRKVISINHIISDAMAESQVEREAYAEFLLKKYQRAHCVITSRLHAALPCLAYETPVLLLNTQSDQHRFEGLKELVHNCSRDQFLSGDSLFDFNRPPENSKDYLPLRENLIRITKKWVNKRCEGLTSPMISSEFPLIHVLIATKGRASLLRMLKSLQSQLSSKDYLTVVFDAQDEANIFGETQYLLEEFTCHHSLIMEPAKLGFWGHGVRNHHSRLAGDLVLHADDDDMYKPDALDIIRKTCVDEETLYIFKMEYANKATLWADHSITAGAIGTPMGAIPAIYNSQSRWGGFYGDDFEFYNELSKIVPKVRFVDEVIYLVRPE